jgi:hypothetical protein
MACGLVEGNGMKQPVVTIRDDEMWLTVGDVEAKIAKRYGDLWVTWKDGAFDLGDMLSRIPDNRTIEDDA